MHRSNHQHIQSPDPWQNDLKFRPRTRRTVKIEPTAQTVDELKKLNLPSGVDITINV